MRLNVAKFGPIRAGEVDLSKRLIVLTGPNHGGKTYLSTAVYGIWNQRSAPPALRPIVEALLAAPDQKLPLDALRPALPVALDEHSFASTAALPGMFAAQPDRFADARLRISDVDWSLRGWSSTGFFVPVGEGLANVQMTLDGPAGEIRIEDRLAFRTTKDQIELPLDEPPRPPLRELPDHLRARIVRTITEMLWMAVFEQALEGRAYFAPAERASLHLFAGELARRRFELVDTAARDVLAARPSDNLFRQSAAYPIPIRDALMREVGPRVTRPNSRLAPLAEELERTVLCGRVHTGPNGEFSFAPASRPDDAMPFHLTASVVKAVASIVQLFRDNVEIGDVLIVDEPELNLHPETQRLVVRVLAKAVNLGVRVILSTHSDFVVRELSHLVMLSAKKPEVRRVRADLGVADESVLAPDVVALYFVGNGAVESAPVSATGVGARTLEDAIDRMNRDAQAIYSALEDS